MTRWAHDRAREKEKEMETERETEREGEEEGIFSARAKHYLLPYLSLSLGGRALFWAQY